MIALLALTAWAAEPTFAVIAPDGAVHPGQPTVLWVAAVDEDGEPPSRAPAVEASAGTVRPSAEQTPPGVWSYVLVPPADGEDVTLTVAALGRVSEHVVDVEPHAPSLLVVPHRVDVLAGTDEVVIDVAGSDLPPPEALQVAVGEGEILGVEKTATGLAIRVRPGESRFPRYVPVLVRDARSDAAPAWSGIRVRTKPRIALQTEPGTTMTLSVGKRSYGPFVADAEGVVTATIDQYPGELSADAVLRDDLGNETVTALPLSSNSQGALAVLASGSRVPGHPEPVVWLRGIHGDGHEWQGGAPACRTAGFGELPTLKVGPGLWAVAMPREIDHGRDLRLQCALGGAAEAIVRVPVASQVPAQLRMRVWPEELSADYPVAEVTVALEDTRGERLPADGIVLRAESGEILMEPTPRGALVARGEYRGHAAVDRGEDLVVARWDRPPGGGTPVAVEVTHAAVPDPDGLDVELFARVLDVAGVPVVGVDVSLSAGAASLYAVTGEDGWARARVPLPAGGAPVVMEARTRWHRARTLALRGAVAAGGPGVPELEERRRLPIRTGRVANIQLVVDPPVLFTGSGSVAFVRLTLLDRYGEPITDEPVEVVASDGVVGPLFVTPAGVYSAEYTPPPGDQSREITVTARTEKTVSATARLLLEPRPVERSGTLSVGAVSNLGGITSPYAALDLEWRLGFWGRRFMLRAGASAYLATSLVDTGIDDAGTAGPDDARLSFTIAPIAVQLLAREDFARGKAVWFGLGPVLAPYSGTARFGGTLTSKGVGMFPPGLSVVAGAGFRTGPGEVALEVRGIALSGTGGGLALQGPVGGLAGLVGYRILY